MLSQEFWKIKSLCHLCKISVDPKLSTCLFDLLLPDVSLLKLSDRYLSKNHKEKVQYRLDAVEQSPLTN